MHTSSTHTPGTERLPAGPYPATGIPADPRGEGTETVVVGEELVRGTGGTRVRRQIRAVASAGLGLLVLGAIVAGSVTSAQGALFLAQRGQIFVTIFLGIFIEAVPFLLAGSVVSGFIAVYVDPQTLDRFVPRQPVLAALAGGLMGLVFPVCECGVVPVTRRLYAKGLPLPVGVAFLLAAPVINPIVIASTYAAFGWGPVLWGRLGFTLLIAFVVGLLFQLATAREILLAPEPGMDGGSCQVHGGQPARGRRAWQALATAGDDFLDMARYLIAGSMLAAGMQTLVPQTALLAIGQGPVLSVFVLAALAFVLSVCSTVDAFLALAFSGTFTTGAVLTFLTFGPMVDVKSSLMFLGVFRRRIVAYLILLPLLLATLIGVFWNLNVGV
jgi:uncharacterized protein